MLAELAMDVGLIAIAIVLIWLACDRLERTSHTIARFYGLPEVVKGSIVMAVSSSFPELARRDPCGASGGALRTPGRRGGCPRVFLDSLSGAASSLRPGGRA